MGATVHHSYLLAAEAPAITGNTTLSIEAVPPMGIEILLKDLAAPLAATQWGIARQMLAKIRGWEEAELSREHVPAKVNYNKQVSAIGAPLAVQEIQEQVVLSVAAGTASAISGCPRARVAPGEVGSVALRVGVRREPAANVAPPAWVRVVVEAVAVEAAAVAEGDNSRDQRKTNEIHKTEFAPTECRHRPFGAWNLFCSDRLLLHIFAVRPESF
jgi:hypothetical protein